MQVYLTGESVILITDDDGHSLSFQPSASSSSSSSSNDPCYTLVPGHNVPIHESYTCLGSCAGIIGKFANNKLVLIQDSEVIGHLPGVRGTSDPVYRISKVSVIDPLTAGCDSIDTPVMDDLTEMDGNPAVDDNLILSPSHGQQQHGHQARQVMRKTWNQIKSAPGQLRSTMLSPSSPSSSNTNSTTAATAGSISPSSSFGQDGGRISSQIRDRRLTETLVKMFTDSHSFYYSISGDLTNTMQRKYQMHADAPDESHQRPWQRTDDRFFWNRHMISDLIDCEDKELLALADHWIIPVMQGFVQIEVCPFHESLAPRVPVSDQVDGHKNNLPEPQLILISRRSRHMAGTRYKRRGINADGECANYVETEQIFVYDKHVVSFTQVRGSIPVFWSQVGHSYRPPPKIEKSESETQTAFNQHFDQQLAIYSKQVIVNLVEANGRESVLGHAYLNHVLNYDSPDVTYVSFDFHEYCRGMRFENVSVLIESLADVIKDMKFCWVDDHGVICKQESVFRVNCVDCLDRTNVVQTAFAKVLLDQQLTRLGLLPPDSHLPSAWRHLFNSMWANNGDILSRQYAGTAALKSDFTRTGERKFTGIVKDGVNSATRYYQNRFKDRTRQAVIDLMLGIVAPDAVDEVDDGIEAENEAAQNERIRLVMEDVKRMLIPENEIILGAWPLSDADSVMCDMDSILILTQDSFSVADYDDDTDRVTNCRRVLLEDLTKMELGLEPSSLSSRLKIKTQDNRTYVLRLFYLIDGQAGYFYAFKSTGTRFFNNMTIPVKSMEDEMECLKAILESFKVALSMKSLSVPVFEGRLDKKRSKLIPNRPHVNVNSKVMSGISNISSKAMSGVSSQLFKFKGRFRHNAGTGGQNTHPVTTSVHLDECEEMTAAAAAGKRELMSESEEEPSNYSTSLFVKGSDDGSDFSGSNLDEDEDEDRELTPTPATSGNEASSSRPASRNENVFLSSCGILTATIATSSPPLKSLSDTDIADTCAGPEIRKANSRVTLHTTSREEPDDNSDENVFNSLPPILTVTEARSDSPNNNQQQQRRSSGSKMMIPPQMQATVSMVNMNMNPSPEAGSDNVDGGGLKESGSSTSHATSCLALSARKSDPSSSKVSALQQMNSSDEHHHHDVAHHHTEVQLPPLSPGAMSRSTILIPGDQNACSGGMKNSVSASEMVSLILSSSPIPSPIAARKGLLMSPFNRIAKGVQSLGINMSSMTTGSSSSSQKSSPKKSSNNNNNNQTPLMHLVDEYDKEKKRKRSSKSRIIEL